jgi:hypothetical protein
VPIIEFPPLPAPSFAMQRRPDSAKRLIMVPFDARESMSIAVAVKL